MRGGGKKRKGWKGETGGEGLSTSFMHKNVLYVNTSVCIGRTEANLPVPEDHADTVDLSKKDVKLRNTISPNPEPIEAHTTPRMTTASMWNVATRMKLARDATTHTRTRILYRKGDASRRGEGRGGEGSWEEGREVGKRGEESN